MSPIPFLRLAVVTLLGLGACTSASLAQDPGAKTTRPADRSSNGQPSAGGAVLERYGAFLVGDEAPDVDLTFDDGTRFHLAAARRVGPWLLVFARTPDDLAYAQAARADLAEIGVGVVGIGPFHNEEAAYDPAVVRLLHDYASHVARTYGLFDPVTSNPRAGAILVGRDGRMLLIVSGGAPSREDLVRMTREALHPSKRTLAETTD